MFDLNQNAVFQGNVQSTGQVLVELLKEHLIPFFVLPVILGVFLLNAVVGQMARLVLEVVHVIGLRRRAQHTLLIEVDVVLMVHQDPASVIQ